MQSSSFRTPQAPDHEPGGLPPRVEAALWRGNELGQAVHAVVPSGFPQLDAHLPGGGWPCQSVTEILVPQYSTLEWRLLSPALRCVSEAGKTIVVVAPPKAPHLPGLRHQGIEDKSLVWIQAEPPAQRLWVLEQLIKSNAGGAFIGWLPQVRQEQIRRLQVLAASCEAPVFLCRPSTAALESSAAPLRVQARVRMDWEIAVNIIKRKGPPLDDTLSLRSVPGSLLSIMTPRLAQPSRLLNRDAHDAVVSPAHVNRRAAVVPH